MQPCPVTGCENLGASLMKRGHITDAAEHAENPCNCQYGSAVRSYYKSLLQLPLLLHNSGRKATELTICAAGCDIPRVGTCTGGREGAFVSSSGVAGP